MFAKLGVVTNNSQEIKSDDDSVLWPFSETT
jgi:hypothetical protein